MSTTIAGRIGDARQIGVQGLHPVVTDLHLRPYYGDEDETDSLYYSEAKAETTAFHAYATFYACVNNKRDTDSDVLAKFLGLLKHFKFDVKAVYLDSSFYDGKCLTLLYARNFAYIIPIIKCDNKIKNELNAGWSREIVGDLTATYRDHEWTVEFPVMINCTYKKGRYRERRVTATPLTHRSSTNRNRLDPITANSS